MKRKRYIVTGTRLWFLTPSERVDGIAHGTHHQREKATMVVVKIRQCRECCCNDAPFSKRGWIITDAYGFTLDRTLRFESALAEVNKSFLHESA